MDEGIGFVSQTSYGYHFPTKRGDTYYITNFETLGAAYGCMSGCVEEQSHPAYAAHECALWFCVNTYNTSISNGKQIQNITSSYKTPNASKEEVENIDSQTTYLNITYQGHNYTLYWLAYDALSAVSLVPSHHPLTSLCSVIDRGRYFWPGLISRHWALLRDYTPC